MCRAASRRYSTRRDSHMKVVVAEADTTAQAYTGYILRPVL